MKPRPTSDSATARLIEAPTAKAVPKAPSMKASMASGTSLPLSGDQQQADDHRADDGDEGNRHAEQTAAIRQRESASARHATCPDIRAPIAPRSLMLGRPLAHQAAAIEHGDAVGDGDQLVELARDQQHADAAARRGADLAVDRLDGADIEAARRLRGDQRHQRIERQLARQHGLLLVAAATGPEKATSGPAARTSNSLHLLAAPPAFSARALQQAEAREAVELVRDTCSRPPTWR